MVLNGKSSFTRLEKVLLLFTGATVHLVFHFREIESVCNNISFKKQLKISGLFFSDIILLSVGNFAQTATNGKSANFLTLNNAGIEWIWTKILRAQISIVPSVIQVWHYKY